jgi:hypothetical protein
MVILKQLCGLSHSRLAASGWILDMDDGIAQSAGLANEIDVVEIHSEIPTLYVVSNHQWSNPGSPSPGAVLNISGIDFTKYHKFGLLWTGDGMSSGRLCYYLDDIERFCSNTTVLEETTRHFLILANGVGCAFAANSDFCINKPVTNATNSGGRVRRAKPGRRQCAF